MGSGVGFGVGSLVGFGVGFGVGSLVGFGVGMGVGSGVGFGVGMGVGSGVGFGVGIGVGCDVGSQSPRQIEKGSKLNDRAVLEPIQFELSPMATIKSSLLPLIGPTYL